MLRVDGHCHLGHGIRRSVSARVLLKEMDRHGIDQAVVCSVDQFLAVDNREGNDLIAQTVKKHPDRLIGFASVNPWYGLAAVDELKRSLDQGLRGLKLNPFIQGFCITDEVVLPLVEVAADYGIPVYCHTGTPVGALPLQLADLAVRFPNVNFIMGHMGSADFVDEVIPAMEVAGNLFAETSKVQNCQLLKRVIERFGAERVIFGTNYPNSSYGVELEKMALLDLTPDIQGWVLGRSILRLIGPGSGCGNDVHDN